MSIRSWASYKAVIEWKDIAETQPVFLHGRRGEVFTKPSVTVPDMSIPLATLLSRYRMGTPVPLAQGVFSNGDDIVPAGFENWSEQEKADFLRGVQKEAGEAKGRMQDREAAKSKAAQKAAFDAAVKAEAEKKLALDRRTPNQIELGGDAPA